jgi:hypothetical protein
MSQNLGQFRIKWARKTKIDIKYFNISVVDRFLCCDIIKNK